MEDVIEALPQGPAGTKQLFDLMRPPRAVGVMIPFARIKGNSDNYVAFYYERGGKIRGAGLTESGWVVFEEMFSPKINDYSWDIDVANEFVEAFSEKLSNRVDYKVEYPDPTELMGKMPPGNHFKYFVPHVPFSEDQLREVRNMFPFQSVGKLWGAKGHGIVGLCVAELSEPYPGADVSYIFTWYNKNHGTWRIHDIAPESFEAPELAQLDEELGEILRDQYDDIRSLSEFDTAP
jgi:hypothetical protein